MFPSEIKTGERIRRAFPSKVRLASEARRVLEFVASDETVDRYGDVILVRGWDDTNFLKNPVFLWAHRSADPPIGKVISIERRMDKPALLAGVQFADKETYPFADTIFKLYKGGFVNAVSVGFLPLEYRPRVENGETVGTEFIRQELLELSAVPVPANPEAVQLAIRKGIVSERELDAVFSGDRDLYEFLRQVLGA